MREKDPFFSEFGSSLVSGAKPVGLAKHGSGSSPGESNILGLPLFRLTISPAT
jgi:hypothetical protein